MLLSSTSTCFLKSSRVSSSRPWRSKFGKLYLLLSTCLLLEQCFQLSTAVVSDIFGYFWARYHSEVALVSFVMQKGLFRNPSSRDEFFGKEASIAIETWVTCISSPLPIFFFPVIHSFLQQSRLIFSSLSVGYKAFVNETLWFFFFLFAVFSFLSQLSPFELG